MATWGNTSGRGLRNQVGGIPELMFDVRWGSIAPWAVVGGAIVVQVANSPIAEPLTGLSVQDGAQWPRGAIPVDADHETST